jgi:eukaryotic-like serine/threonine-protein kinase
MPEPISFYKSGDMIEGLRILQELGQGAASTVYLAQDPKDKQIWAVKHVHRATEKDDRFLDQAEYEYKVAKELNHPNLRSIPRLHKQRKLLTVTDIILVMEFADGYSMEKKRPKTYEDAIEIFYQTAQALRHMHEKGFVHADMKPNNIMVAPGPLVKVVDLGQSCKVGTVKPRIQGTPDYIAPEQVMRQPITARTDVYNLGATMYWTLTRRTVPTPLNSKNENSLVDRIDPSLMPKPTPIGEIDHNCHPKLAELVMHCVEIDPEDRPTTMAYVCDRLQLVLGMVRAARQTASDAKKSGDSATLLDGSKTGTGSSGSGMKLDSKSGSTSVLGVKFKEQGK